MKALGTKIIGIWDDHDYGKNDAGKEFELKHETRELFLDYIEEPMDSIRRLDKNSTIHQDYIIQHNDFMVHVILLDNRFEYDKVTTDKLGQQ